MKRTGPTSPRRRRATLQVSELFRPLVVATLLMIIIFTIGVTGYSIVGGSRTTLLDAIYMTVITLTTVGFEEHIDLSGHPGGQIFTIVLLFLGVGTFVYFFSSLTSFIVEGNLEHLFWRNRMEKDIDRLSDHYIVCGGGHTGQHIVAELLSTSRPFVLIEREEAHILELQEQLGARFPALVGDATDDETLTAAGIRRAGGLFACLSNDKDNLIITVSARLIKPGIRIVCRATDAAQQKKLQRAGADVSVSPSMIGGLRMTSEMVRPTVVSFLDVMLRDRDRRLRVEESKIMPGGTAAGISTGELRRRAPREALLMAVRKADQQWLFNPGDDLRLEPGMTLIYMAGPEVREEMNRLAGGPGER